MLFECILISLFRKGWLTVQDLGRYDISLSGNSRKGFLKELEFTYVIRFKPNILLENKDFKKWITIRDVETNQHLFNDKFEPSGFCHYPSIRFTWSNITDLDPLEIRELQEFGESLLFPGLEFNSRINTQMPITVIVHSLITEHLSHHKNYKQFIAKFNCLFPKTQGVREIRTCDIFHIVLGLLSLVRTTSKIYKSWKLLGLSLKTSRQLCNEGVVAIVTLFVELFDKQRVFIGRTVLGGNPMQGLFANSCIQRGEEFAHGIYITCNKSSTSCEQHEKQGLFGVPFCINSVTKAISYKLNVNVVFRDKVITNILNARTNCIIKSCVNVTYVQAVDDIAKKDELFWKYTVHRSR